MGSLFDRERIKYQFDRLISRGTVAMICLLFAVMFLIVCAIGAVAYLFSDGGDLFGEIWNSLMHTLDAGTLAGNPTSNVPYLVMMSLATLCGLFITSVLIGIVASGVENKLQDLRKGISNAQETDHTVIIGFNDDIYTLLNELIEANANKKKACIVVLGEQEKEYMEEAIAAHIPNTRTTHIICRSGRVHESYSLERCAVENCRSVIINVFNDAEVIKTILALSAYLKDVELACPDLRFIAAVQDSSHIDAAVIAGEGRAEVFYAKSSISRIIAHTCRQHGLSQVLTELLNFGGNELYIEKVPGLQGKNVREVARSFRNATLVGLYNGEKAVLNPPMTTVLGKNDMLVLLEEDDGSYVMNTSVLPNYEAMASETGNKRIGNDNLLVLGSNDKLPVLLEEYSRYVTPGTKVIVLDDDLRPEYIREYDNLEITVRTERVTRDLLCELLDGEVSNVLLLNDDSEESERSDANTLFRLILLRDIADSTNHHFGISTEMCNVDNQRLATKARVDDFVIGSNYVSLLLAQISENYRLRPIIRELLSEEGSEFYMKPAANYVKIGVPVNGYTLTESAASRGEIYVGYRHMDPVPENVVVNADKDKLVTFSENDLLIVIAEN